MRLAALSEFGVVEDEAGSKVREDELQLEHHLDPVVVDKTVWLDRREDEGERDAARQPKPHLDTPRAVKGKQEGIRSTGWSFRASGIRCVLREQYDEACEKEFLGNGHEVEPPEIAMVG